MADFCAHPDDDDDAMNLMMVVVGGSAASLSLEGYVVFRGVTNRVFTKFDQCVLCKVKRKIDIGILTSSVSVSVFVC